MGFYGTVGDIPTHTGPVVEGRKDVADRRPVPTFPSSLASFIMVGTVVLAIGS